MNRLTLNDAQWAKIAPYCAGKETDRGRTAADNRLFIDYKAEVMSQDFTHKSVG